MRIADKLQLATIFLGLLFFVNAVRSYAPTDPTLYYVSPTGNDSNPGTESLPWRTLAKAVSMATAGVTVFIKQGTYSERLVPIYSGTPEGLITFTSYPGDFVTIDGEGMRDPTLLSGLIFIDGLEHIKISGLRVLNSANVGIQVKNSSHITIEKNYIDNTYDMGIKVHACKNIIVEANEVVRGCMGTDLEECLSVSTTNLIEIRNNKIHDGKAIGIDVKYGSSNAIVSKNEVYNQTEYIGIYIEAWTLHEFNIDVFNNSTHDNKIGFAVTSEMGGLIDAITLHHNVAYRNQQRGIWIGGWGGGQLHPLKNIKVYGNESYENGFGIEIGGYTGTSMDSVEVFSNLIYRNKNAGIRITRYDEPSGEYLMRNIEIINNTIYENGTLGVGWEADNAGINVFSNMNPQNLVIRNNILSDNAFCTIFLTPEVPAASVTIDYNFFDGFRNIMYETAGTNAVFGNPLFVDSLTNDYHLRATSPCIDNGSPNREYDDPVDPQKPGYASYPAGGTIRNDMGAYGGPGAGNWNTATSVESNPQELTSSPETFELFQNYPNPFNPTTTIKYQLSQSIDVSLKIYNLLGQLIRALIDEKQTAGNYSIIWNGEDNNGQQVANGIYMYRIHAQKFVKTKKMVLIR